MGISPSEVVSNICSPTSQPRASASPTSRARPLVETMSTDRDPRENNERWDEVLDDLARRRDISRAMGGEDRLRKRHDGGKLDARARIAYLLDDGSFLELGTLVGGSDAPADA